MLRSLVFVLSLLVASVSYAQPHSHQSMHALHYPNIEGYVTLKTDLHQHTVFSDGEVWPSIRVMEALRENLDVISLTEHLEYQPHKDDIPHPDRNRSYQLALEEARDHKLLVINGSEITRDAPVGHSNAIFIQDANPLLSEEPKVSFKEANKQGAFVFWNHPAWYAQSPTGNPVLSKFQLDRIKNKELHGIEVINEFDYAQESLALALKHNLTIIGTSDIHGLIDWQYLERGNHRPITLVFAKERTLESTKEALFAGRTVAVYNSLFVGREEYLKPLLKSCVEVIKAKYIEDTQILQLTLKNLSSSDLIFENQMPYSLYSKAPVFTIKASEEINLNIKTLKRKDQITLTLKALSAYIAPNKQAVIDWEIEVD
ncbi:MAG: PHP domain-containing protein [Eudoraea sp.]|nr:PHP domain-containing protein [Eudoraea sp.]